MAPLEIAAIYIAACSLLLLVLAYNVGARRGKQKKLQPGDTGDASLTRAIRAHANFAEHAPIVLLLLLTLAFLAAPSWLLHAFGATFVVGRIAHAAGMMRQQHPNALRFFGNLTTGLALLVGPVAILVLILNR